VTFSTFMDYQGVLRSQGLSFFRMEKTKKGG